MSWTINRGNENSLKSRFPGNVQRHDVGGGKLPLFVFLFINRQLSRDLDRDTIKIEADGLAMRIHTSASPILKVLHGCCWRTWCCSSFLFLFHQVPSAIILFLSL